MVAPLPLARMQIQALLLPASCLLPLLWLTSPLSLGRPPFHPHHCRPPLQVLGLDRQSGQGEDDWNLRCDSTVLQMAMSTASLPMPKAPAAAYSQHPQPCSRLEAFGAHVVHKQSWCKKLTPRSSLRPLTGGSWQVDTPAVLGERARCILCQLPSLPFFLPLPNKL